MKRKSKRTVFAVCINNTGYPASLEAGKLYQVVSDAEAEKHGLIRVIDESGEDYGYSAERFFVLNVPHALEKVLKEIPSAGQLNTARKPTIGASTSRTKRATTQRRSRLGL
jgi:hypothetical protein